MINYATIIIIMVVLRSTCLVHAGGILDPYQILGVSHSASAKEIQSQYRKKGMLYSAPIFRINTDWPSLLVWSSCTAHYHDLVIIIASFESSISI
jgi:hypothetical protein